MRSLDDVKAWLSQDCVGSAETAAAPWWRLLLKYKPGIKIVTIRRPVREVVNSLLALDMHGVCSFDRHELTARMKRLDAKLSQIEQRIPNVLSIDYSDLNKEAVCAAIFEHCLPYQHNWARWAEMAGTNIQISVPQMMRYAMANRSQLAHLASIAKQATLLGFSTKPPILADGLSIAQEPFDKFMAEGKALFAEHSIEVGEEPGSYLTKNIPLMRDLDNRGSMQILVARSNGRMFGYLMTVIAPSLETLTGVLAVHTLFFASPEFPGLGAKLQRAALIALRKRRIDEVFFRAGPRGSGPRMGSLYRRMGAHDDGQLFRLSLKEA